MSPFPAPSLLRPSQTQRLLQQELLCRDGVVGGNHNLLKGRILMIYDVDIRCRDNNILLGISVENAVLDIVTNVELLQRCLATLRSVSAKGSLERIRIGEFGNLPIMLNVNAHGSVDVFVDGPDFEPGRNQSAAIVLPVEELIAVIESAFETP